MLFVASDNKANSALSLPEKKNDQHFVITVKFSAIAII